MGIVLDRWSVLGRLGGRRPWPSPGRRIAVVSHVGRALVAIGLIGHFVHTVPMDDGTDFRTFYSAGYTISQTNETLYEPREVANNPFWTSFKLPPPAALYLAPLGFLTYERARLAWAILTVAAYFLSFALLCTAFGVRFLSWPWLGALAAWVSFEPARAALRGGQWDTLFLLVLALATLGSVSTRPFLAAFTVALGATAKPHLLMTLLFFVAKRWWTGLAWAAIALVALSIAGAMAVGPGEAGIYLTEVLPASGATTAYPDNQALGGVLARMAMTDLRPVPVRGLPWVDGAIRIVALALAVTATYVVSRAPSPDPNARALQFALFVPLSVLAIPVAWSHYQTTLLIPLYLLGVDYARRPPAWPGWVMLVAGFLLVAVGDPSMIMGDQATSALWDTRLAPAANRELEARFPGVLSRFLLSYKTLGALIVFGLLTWRVWITRATGSAR